MSELQKRHNLTVYLLFLLRIQSSIPSFFFMIILFILTKLRMKAPNYSSIYHLIFLHRDKNQIKPIFSPTDAKSDLIWKIEKWNIRNMSCFSREKKNSKSSVISELGYGRLKDENKEASIKKKFHYKKLTFPYKFSVLLQFLVSNYFWEMKVLSTSDDSLMLNAIFLILQLCVECVQKPICYPTEKIRNVRK